MCEISKITQERVHLVFAATERLKAREERLSRMIETINEQPYGNFGEKDFDGEPRELPQLQVADLVAYEITAYRSVHRHRDGEGVRRQYRMLRKKLRLHVADPPHIVTPAQWQW